ncbi:hypothetical protein H0266_11875 [Halobacillus locisalis]|uniref:Uncharacterized protein n=1 Tax=Halobacillus locisalis TaxID=220753 RepID=A0A838CUD6_9BACI|nr:hypothetical protein [Halobacillus locisalis]MBA2175590.1 hypothetical protein [Halobacillus locisalis]
MVWLMLTFVVTLIAFTVYFDQSEKRKVKANVAVKDHKALEQEYYSRGTANESAKHEHF